MPATTYLHARDLTEPTGHKDLDETLAEVRKVSGEDWRIGVMTYTTGRFWWKKSHSIYGLYIGVGGCEFQIINFYRDGTTWSINHSVTAELLVAYMYGYIGGFQRRSFNASGEPR